jgi:hypothetical protein
MMHVSIKNNMILVCFSIAFDDYKKKITKKNFVRKKKEFPIKIVAASGICVLILLSWSVFKLLKNEIINVKNLM